MLRHIVFIVTCLSFAYVLRQLHAVLLVHEHNQYLSLCTSLVKSADRQRLSGSTFQNSAHFHTRLLFTAGHIDDGLCIKRS